MPLCDEIAERLEDDSSPDMDIMLEAAELRRAVSRLTPRSRQILEGYYFGGRTFREIAKTMELSESRVGQLHRTAIGELRQVLLGMGYSGLRLT
jgi:RNA polymerase sigma factor for flagellar operon FliA